MKTYRTIKDIVSASDEELQQAGGIRRQLWGMFPHTNAKGQLISFGAEDIYFVKEWAGLQVFMVRYGKKWYYSHAEKDSVYVCLGQGYDGPTGEVAWLRRIVYGRKADVHYLEVQLNQCQESLRLAEEELADKLYPTN